MEKHKNSNGTQAKMSWTVENNHKNNTKSKEKKKKKAQSTGILVPTNSDSEESNDEEEQKAHVSPSDQCDLCINMWNRERKPTSKERT